MFAFFFFFWLYFRYFCIRIQYWNRARANCQRETISYGLLAHKLDAITAEINATCASLITRQIAVSALIKWLSAVLSVVIYAILNNKREILRILPRVSLIAFLLLFRWVCYFVTVHLMNLRYLRDIEIQCIIYIL